MKARYSAAVSAHRGVAIRSMVGSSARFRKKTTRSSAPVSSKSCVKNEASCQVIPMAAKTTAKLLLLPAAPGLPR